MNQMIDQVKQLLNIQLIKYINSGDKVLDNVLVLIINTSAVLIVTYIASHLKMYRYADMDTSPISIKHETLDMSSYTIENVNKYTFSMKICYDDVYRWTYHVYGHVNYTENISLGYNYKKNELCLTSNKDMPRPFMPIYKYSYNNKQEYIWWCDGKLMSNNINKLNELCKLIYDYKCSLSITESTANKIIYLSYRNNTAYSFVNPHKTFDSLYFSDKPILIETLDKFKAGTLYPKSLGMSNKLGILLSGPPGTGKTGCISAVANYINRDLIIIDSLEGLKTVLRNTEAYYKSAIIVFDEFDYVLSSASNKKPSCEDDEGDEDIVMSLKNADDTDKIYKKLQNAQDNDIISILLKYLDGISDDNERIIIATTNNPEKINPLFLRPGRFDLKLELSYCTINIIQDIIRNVYPEYIYDHISHGDIVSKHVSPLDVINKMMMTNNLKDLLVSLNTH